MFYRIGTVRSDIYECMVADRCPFCKQMSEMKYVVYQNFFVLALPVFPVGKEAEVKCSSCQMTMTIYSAPEFVIQRHISQFAQVKTPLRAYTLLIFIGLAFLYSLITTPVNEWKDIFLD